MKPIEASSPMARWNWRIIIGVACLLGAVASGGWYFYQNKKFQQALAKQNLKSAVDAQIQNLQPAQSSPAVKGATTKTSNGSAASKIVNLNTASAAELETLPGIGAVKAQAILDYRQTIGRFTRVEQLDNVKGIGPATLAKLKPYLTLE